MMENGEYVEGKAMKPNYYFGLEDYKTSQKLLNLSLIRDDFILS